MLRSFLEVWFIMSSSQWAEKCPVVTRRQATGDGGAVHFFPLLPPVHAWHILWSNSVAEQLCGEAVSLWMVGGRLLPRCWWLSGSVRFSRLVQVGR